MPIYFEDIFNDGGQAGIVFKKPVTTAAGTALTAGGAVAINVGTSTVGPNVYAGSGAPTVSAPKGSIYMRSDGQVLPATRAYINTDGATTWTAVTTAA
jgi:hypothetical protein